MKCLAYSIAILILCTTAGCKYDANDTDSSSSGSLSIKATGTGYGKYNQLFSTYCSGQLSNVIDYSSASGTAEPYIVTTNSTDSEGTTSNTVTFVISFSSQYVSKIVTKWTADSSTVSSFTVKVSDGTTATSIVSSYAVTDGKSYTVEKTISSITVTCTMSKFNSSSARSNYYFKLYYCLPYGTDNAQL